MSRGIIVKETKDEFLQANRHNIELVFNVRRMSEKEFKTFIEPLKMAFRDTFD